MSFLTIEKNKEFPSGLKGLCKEESQFDNAPKYDPRQLAGTSVHS
jgi:hypothetical protein